MNHINTHKEGIYKCPECEELISYAKKEWSPIYLYFFCSHCGCKIFKIGSAKHANACDGESPRSLPAGSDKEEE